MSSVPVPAPRMGSATALGPFVVYPVKGRALESGKPAPAIGDYIASLWRAKWIVMAFVVAAVALTYVVSKNTTKMYEASSTIDIDRSQPTGILGPESNLTIAPDMDQLIATQMRILQSDAVLRPVVFKYGLLAAEGRKPDTENGPIRLKNLRVSRPPNTYLVQVSYRHSNPETAAEVANAIAASYVDQLRLLRQGAWSNVSGMTQHQLQTLKERMEASVGELAKLQAQLGMVDPEDKTNVLTARLLQLNADYARAQTDLASKEAAWESVRGGLPEAAEVSLRGDQLGKLLERRNEANQKFSDLKAVYGENHPEYRRAQSQVKELDEQVTTAYRKIVRRAEAEVWEARSRESKVRTAYIQSKEEADKISVHTLQYRMLKQKADADRALYEELARKVNEAQINTELKSNGVRIADPARADFHPASPNTGLNCAIAFVASFLLVGGFVVTRDAGKQQLRGPEDVRAAIPCDVVSLLPAVPVWRKRKDLGAQFTKAPDEKSRKVAILRFREAIRMLRGRLAGVGRLQSNRIVAVVSATAGEGRSTAAAHLAIACANLGRRTLLIDGDLRRPNLHTLFFAAAPDVGLCEVLSGEVQMKDALIRPSTHPNLHLLPAGGPNERGSELLTDRLTSVLEDVLPLYDLVILDSPPFLRYAEAVDIVRVADAVVVVTRKNHTNPKALAMLEQYLERLGSNVAAVALNEAGEDKS